MSFEDKIEPSGEIYAAIAMALCESNSLETHAEESDEIYAAIATALFDAERSGETQVNQSGEVYAAIAMALYEHKDIDFQSKYHDEESMVLTIKRTVNFYSPWNLKTNTMKELPLTRKNNGTF